MSYSSVENFKVRFSVVKQGNDVTANVVAVCDDEDICQKIYDDTVSCLPGAVCQGVDVFYSAEGMNIEGNYKVPLPQEKPTEE